MSVTGERWGRPFLASMLAAASALWLAMPMDAHGARTIALSASRLEVGVAIDAVVAAHEEVMTVHGGEGAIERPIPDGALLLSASIEACGAVHDARSLPASRVSGADAKVKPIALEPGGLAARALALRARVDPTARVPAAVRKKAAEPVARGQVLSFALPPGVKRAPRGWRPLAAVAPDGAAPRAVDGWRDEGGGARGKSTRLARLAFRVRTVASRVGGRSGTQLRDRLERHRDALEIAFGADLPHAVTRARRATLDLTVTAAGAVSAVSLRLDGHAEPAAIPQAHAVLERLAFDALPGGDGLETRLSVELELR